jgi:hydroxymethylbilane synthase
MPSVVRIGTRGSDLARWQADHVGWLLRAAYPDLAVETVVIATSGDRIVDTPLPLIGGKGVFTAELEAALRGGEIDLAVHSLKDLPTDEPAGLTIGAVPGRAEVFDVLISRAAHRLASLPEGAAVGTSSRRRAAQLMSARPDLRIIDLRGNVPTRIDKALDPAGPYDAIVLARAGVERLGRLDDVSEVLSLEVMLPAPGQGALAIQCRAELPSLNLLRPLDHAPTRAAVTAERAFLAGLGGGCSVPIAAYAVFEQDVLNLWGRVCALDGSRRIEVSIQGAAAGDSSHLGQVLAEEALQRGASDLLEVVP